MEDKLFSTILNETYTQASLNRRLRALRTYINLRLFTKEMGPKAEDFDPDDLHWLISLGDDFYLKFNKDNFDNLLDAFEKKIPNLPVLTIFIPFDMPGGEQIHMGELLRKRYGRGFLFEIKHDGELLAGCALVWKGVYRDYSIRHRIEENKARVLANLKGFLK